MISSLLKIAGDEVAKYMIRQLTVELMGQGHKLTGTLIQSLEAKVDTASGLTIAFLMERYGIVLNDGVKASRIPYSGRRPETGRSGRTSKYIQGLIEYVKRRKGLSGKEAKSMAFAIAAKHKKEGMPTKGSFKYASNGRRLGWIDYTITEESDAITAIIARYIEIEITTILEKKLIA